METRTPWEILTSDPSGERILMLYSLRQEYITICEEMHATTDEQRKRKLYDQASACIQQFVQQLEVYCDVQRTV
jgi:hypothetical protein